MIVLYAAALSGLLAVVTAWSYQRMYGEARILAELSRLSQLRADAASPVRRGLTLTLETSREGESRTLQVAYSLALPNAGSLTLRRRPGRPGSETDFDDYFRVENCRADYLSVQRQDLLLQLFEDLEPEEIINGVVHGKISCARGPWGVAKVAGALDRLERFGWELSNQPSVSRG